MHHNSMIIPRKAKYRTNDLQANNLRCLAEFATLVRNVCANFVTPHRIITRRSMVAENCRNFLLLIRSEIEIWWTVAPWSPKSASIYADVWERRRGVLILWWCFDTKSKSKHTTILPKICAYSSAPHNFTRRVSAQESIWELKAHSRQRADFTPATLTSK